MGSELADRACKVVNSAVDSAVASKVEGINSENKERVLDDVTRLRGKLLAILKRKMQSGALNRLEFLIELESDMTKLVAPVMNSLVTGVRKKLTEIEELSQVSSVIKMMKDHLKVA